MIKRTRRDRRGERERERLTNACIGVLYCYVLEDIAPVGSGKVGFHTCPRDNVNPFLSMMELLKHHYQSWPCISFLVDAWAVVVQFYHPLTVIKYKCKIIKQACTMSDFSTYEPDRKCLKYTLIFDIGFIKFLVPFYKFRVKSSGWTSLFRSLSLPQFSRKQ